TAAQYPSPMNSITNLKAFAALLAASVAALALSAAPAQLPELSEIEWTTNYDDPPIGDPVNAIRGGTLTDFIDTYPLTFRIVGPNSNDSFASWKRAFTMDFALVVRHPVTE